MDCGQLIYLWIARTLPYSQGMITTKQLAKQLQELVTLRRTLAREPGDLDLIAVERTAEAMDGVHQLAEHDLAVRLLGARAARLREVYGALDRLRRGSYGICCDCEEAINWRRLEVVPWAIRCTTCQDRKETDQGAETERYETSRSDPDVA